MQRLTIKNAFFADVAKCEEPSCAECQCGAEGRLIPGMCDARAVYERLREFENKMDDGLLFELPQATVYVLSWDAGRGCTLQCPEIPIEDISRYTGVCSMCEMGELSVREVQCRQSHLDELGVRCFLTKEDAEAQMYRVLRNRSRLWSEGGGCLK